MKVGKIFCITYLSILSLLVTINSQTFKNEGESCVSSFECSTACCSSGKCGSKDSCSKIILSAYLICAAASLVILIITGLYLFLQIRETKRNVIHIKEKVSQKNAEELRGVS